MALSLEQLQAQRDEIVLNAGLVRVQYGDRSIEYSRQQETLALIDAEIARQSPQTKQFTIQTSRGL